MEDRSTNDGLRNPLIARGRLDPRVYPEASPYGGMPLTLERGGERVVIGQMVDVEVDSAGWLVGTFEVDQGAAAQMGLIG